MAKPKKKATDWEAIEREFRAGQLSNAEIARQHGITEGAIRKKAKAEGWVKDLSDQVRTKVRADLVRAEVREPHARTNEIVDAAAARGVDVVRSHRKDIAQLRSITTELARRARMALGLEEMDPAVNLRATFGDKDSIADVVDKLSRATQRLVPLERQAFNLDEPGAKDNPAGALSLEQVKRMAREVVEDGNP